MKIRDLLINHLDKPIGYDTDTLTLSWKIQGDGKNTASLAAISVNDEDGNTVLSAAGDCEESYTGFPIEAEYSPRSRYTVQLKLSNEEEALCSAETFFETGKMDEPWKAVWISSDKDPDQPFFVCKNVVLDKKPGKARLYLCGLGLYEVWINGKKAGDEVLSPGYHAYDFHLQVDTLDVTDLLREGDNDVRIYLADGWYRGRLGFGGGYTNLYGDRDCVIAELWADDDLAAATDTTWTWSASPVLFSNIYDGEIYDPGFVIGDKNAHGSCAQWTPKRCGKLCDRINPPITTERPLEVKEVIHTPAGETVLDFGQEITGWVTFEVPKDEEGNCLLPKGTALLFTGGEILQDGNFFNGNYRSAKTQFGYISDGEARAVRPHFTFYGFRYAKVQLLENPAMDSEMLAIQEPLENGPKENRIVFLKGTDAAEKLPDIKSLHILAVPIFSRMKQTGEISTGVPEVNRLFLNVIWGQKDNFLDVPTDCPQRDERLGWTGDAQIFSETAAINFDTSAFYRKYLWDLRAEQSIIGGSGPNVVPRLKAGMVAQYGSSPWQDVAVVIPWNVYRQYGDRALLKETYPGMKALVDSIRKHDEEAGGPHLVKDGFHFGDWLALDNDEPGPFGATDPLFIASAYYYQDAKSVSEAAKALDKKYPGYLDDVREYSDLADDILSAIRDKYFDEEGLCRIRTQTASAVSIMMDLNPTEESRAQQGEILASLVKENNSHLNTGFVGTAMLLPALSKSGHSDLAVTLLLNNDFPSWLYAVNLGATTIWERWNSVLPDGHLNSDGMNSLNHYSYGSIAGWMYRYLGGIREEAPGYTKAVIAPYADRRLGHFEARIDTASGVIISRWRFAGDKLIFEVRVPYGTKAVFSADGIREELSDGTYTFEVARPE